MTTITSDLEQQLINDYLTSNLKTRDIIEKYKIDDIKFQNIRQKYGNPYRDPKLNKIQLNEDYFESIDTPAKAYYLGFIAGDGYLRYREKMNIYILRIELHVKDVDILEKFKKDLESEHTITLSKRFDKKFQVERESCIIEISNEKLCTDIIKNGVGMNKSKELDLPKISDYLMRYYIRGLTDSDGSWFVRSNKEEITFNICSPIYEYLKKVQLFLIEKCELDEIKIQSNPEKSCYHFSYGGNVQCKRIYDYLYDNEGPRLDRKYKLSTDHFNNVTIKYPNSKNIRKLNLEHSYSKYTHNICKCNICKLCNNVYNRFRRRKIKLITTFITELSTKYIKLYEADYTDKKIHFYKAIDKEYEERKITENILANQ